MNLNIEMWKEFCLNDLFNIFAGIYHYPDEYDEGFTPYISASNENNGISQYINLEPEFPGNCIVTGKVGCTAFYQEKPFCATSDVNILVPKNFELNERIGLFFVTIINKGENYKWSYGRQCRVGDSKEIYIKLPVKYFEGKLCIDDKKLFSREGYIPDFKFMDEFMSSLHHKKVTTTQKKKDDEVSIDSWKMFRFGDLFERNMIYKGKAHVKADMEVSEVYYTDCIRFITRTENTNGCDGYVQKELIDDVEEGNALIIGDTTSTCFYQENEFITGDHIIICRAKWLNKYTGLFIKTILEKERYRYSYGRAFKQELVKDTIIPLPCTNDGLPDWNTMEQIIKTYRYAEKI